MAIDWRFIAALEGAARSDGYVPDPDGSRSGVTVATGVDLGQMDATGLAALELPAALAAKLAPYLGLKRRAAADFLAARPLRLTAAEVAALDGALRAAKLAAIRRAYDAAAGAGRFDRLSDPVQTVICSVAFQYGAGLARRTPRFWAACTEARWADAEAELRDFGDRYPSRRRREADLLAAAPERRVPAARALDIRRPPPRTWQVSPAGGW